MNQPTGRMARGMPQPEALRKRPCLICRATEGSPVHRTKRIKFGTVVHVPNGRDYLVHTYDPGDRRR